MVAHLLTHSPRNVVRSEYQFLSISPRRRFELALCSDAMNWPSFKLQFLEKTASLCLSIYTVSELVLFVSNGRMEEDTVDEHKHIWTQ